MPPGFAKMTRIRSFDQDQNFTYHRDWSRYGDYQKFDVELRELSYDIVPEGGKDVFDTILK